MDPKRPEKHRGALRAWWLAGGAARFKSSEAMWDYVDINWGKLQYEAMGTKIYANPDSMYDPNPNKNNAIRKVVRLIIEENGGDGQAVKKDIVSRYGKGKVLWKEDPVAEWNEATGQMKLLGAATAYQDKYNKLMGTE